MSAQRIGLFSETLLDGSDLQQKYESCQRLPAKHFPAFCACGRVGGGFCIEGSCSNAKYSRHMQNISALPPPPAAAGDSIQLATAGVAALSNLLIHDTLQQCNLNSSQAAPDAESSAAGNCQQLRQQQQQQQHQITSAPFLPTTFARALSVPHSSWHHDGTDFTQGYAQQLLPTAWANRPHTAAAAGSSTSRRTLSGVTSRYMEPTRRQLEQMQHRPVKGPWTTEVARILDPARPKNNTSDSWFCDKPIDFLKIEREQQRAAEHQRLSVFHPTEDAKYPHRSFAVHRSAILHRCDEDQGDQDRDLGQGWNLSSSSGHSTPCDEAGRSDHGGSEADVNGEAQSIVQVAGKHSPFEASLSAATEEAAAAAAADDAISKRPAWWEADKKLARLVRQMLAPSFAQTLGTESVPAGSSTDNTASSSSGRRSSDRAVYSTTVRVYNALIAENAVKAADIGRQMAGNKAGISIGSSSNNTTAASSNSVEAWSGFAVLQTPAERHVAWVAELVARTAHQRQHQVLLEAVVAGTHN